MSREFCDKCGSYNHTTNEHIMDRIVRYNIDITPDPICTKCLGTTHPRKYCDIYTSNSYYSYLDKVFMLERDKFLINNCKNSETYRKRLEEFSTKSMEYQISFIMNNDNQPREVLKPFVDIMYQQHSSEIVNEHIETYYN
jgi:hypothetical protein